ncbi:MAG: AraC family transcriptional regulator ligand-binding domain-containing protein [Verrucomicrobiales bacterium]
MDIPLTRIATFTPFIKFIDRGGGNIEGHLDSVGICSDRLGSAEALIPLRQACQFVDEFERREGVNSLGLEVGSRSSIGEMGLFGTLLRQSLTLRDLIGRLIRWVPVVDSGATVWLEDLGSKAPDIRLCIQHRTDVGRRVVDGFGLLLLIDAVRMVAGAEWRPRAVSFDPGPGSDLGRFEALADARVARDIGYAAFEIPRDLLACPLADPPRGTPCAGAGEDALRSSAPPIDLVSSVFQTVRASLGSRIPTITNIAELAGCSVRSVQLELASQGYFYRDILRRVRFDEAQRLLAGGRTPLREIAHYLGYSEVANFSHAYRSWTGESPSNYRRRLR